MGSLNGHLNLLCWCSAILAKSVRTGGTNACPRWTCVLLCAIRGDLLHLKQRTIVVVWMANQSSSSKQTQHPWRKGAVLVTILKKEKIKHRRYYVKPLNCSQTKNKFQSDWIVQRTLWNWSAWFFAIELEAATLHLVHEKMLHIVKVFMEHVYD